jgi:hypothetical protein
MRRIAISVLSIVLLGTTLIGQAPKEPVWVPQTVPFGGIAALAGIPELRAVFPMAGPMTLDARLAEKSPTSETSARRVADASFKPLIRTDGPT